MKKTLILLFLSFMTLGAFAQKDFYELRVYTMKRGGPASGLHNYLEKALMPALNKEGVKNIGVFEEFGMSQPAKFYLLIPYASMSGYEAVYAKLKTDKTFINASKEYNQLSQEAFPYERVEVSHFIAFNGIPKLVKPVSGSMLFELRTYESYGEDAARRKRKMFNDGELEIFEKTGLHSVFFGEKIAGAQMPALTYMLAFENMDERDANWAKFIANPDWKVISGLDEYANSVSDIKRVFLKPLSYSQL
ncbi:MAG: hypothetical protein ACI9IP_000448 [Arcticibacterium sp.]|jgi:hypothetical protein